MKNNRFLLFIAVILILLLAACAGAVEKTADPAGEDISQSATESINSDSEGDSGMDEIDAASIYSQRCSSCHGADREGANGPPLLPGVLNKDAAVYIDTITNGSGPMPSWKGRLSTDEINAMVEFIMSEIE